MAYSLKESEEAIGDVTNLAAYMIKEFKNQKAAIAFLDGYDEAVQILGDFPFGYRGISFEYRGYEIRIKPFGTYNIFFIVDNVEDTIYILRVLKDRQNWSLILRSQKEYHF